MVLPLIWGHYFPNELIFPGEIGDKDRQMALLRVLNLSLSFFFELFICCPWY
jgi:hypothetical protein